MFADIWSFTDACFTVMYDFDFYSIVILYSGYSFGHECVCALSLPILSLESRQPWVSDGTAKYVGLSNISRDWSDRWLYFIH